MNKLHSIRLCKRYHLPMNQNILGFIRSTNALRELQSIILRIVHIDFHIDMRSSCLDN